MRNRFMRGLATLVAGVLIAVGFSSMAPASAAMYPLTIKVLQNGVGTTQAHAWLHEYDPVSKSWEETEDEYSDAGGVITFSADSTKQYRLCYHSDGPSALEVLCYGGDTVAEATTIQVTGPTNLGTVNLAPQKVVDMSRVRIIGKPVVGQRLTIDLSSLPDGIDYVSRSWYQDPSHSAGGDVQGQYLGSAPFYVIKPSDAGHTISVQLCPSGPRWRCPGSASGESEFMAPVLGPIVKPMALSNAPRITAPKWRKGRTASYVAPTVTPAGAATAFQWLRNGKVIKGATSSTHKIVRKDRRKRLTLQVTYSMSGYETTTVVSPRSPRIR